jgi:hypothetical protein
MQGPVQTCEFYYTSCANNSKNCLRIKKYDNQGEVKGHFNPCGVAGDAPLGDIQSSSAA